MTSSKPPRGRSIEMEWRWVELMIAAFVFTPELRRLIDWKGSFSSIDVVSPLPLAMLLPIIYFAFRNRRRLAGSPFVIILVGWAIAFGYGAIAGYVQLAGLTALYGLAIFGFPIAVGAWLITLDMPARDILARFARCMLLFGAISGIYGVFQFIVAPAWDTEWMININAGSFGEPVPFGIRVFGTLNGPGAYGSYMASTIIMIVATLDLRKPWVLFGVAAIFVGLVLCQVRTSWLEVVLGLMILMFIHPSRVKSLLNIAALTAVSAVAITAFLIFSPDETIRYTLLQRVSTFQDVSEDGSARDRANSANQTLKASFANPQGIGIGGSGVAAKLTPSTTTDYFYTADPAIDNGYISRLYEMGYFGFAAFMLTIAACVIVPIAAYRRARASGARDDMGACAVSIAFVVGTLGSFYGGDVIQGITGVLFFVVIAVASRVFTELEPGKASAVAGLHSGNITLKSIQMRRSLLR